MRKIVAMAMATGMALTMAACGGKEEAPTQSAPSAVATADKMDKMESASPEAMESTSPEAMESASPEAMSPSEGASAPAGDQAATPGAAVSLETLTCKDFLQMATERPNDPALAMELGKVMLERGINVTDNAAAEEFGMKLGMACVQPDNADKLVADVAKTL
ncbi:hypothetical protein [Buchananella hordeovulneris]|uniref:hypothetical protein n=1 Tax=Buchananella hordeovulneris TaxID=52770 RepID=UPI000F5EB00C|nr:hypothetical protein [Buchananella hordeovulneris]RRD42993.1 hypothetical protein EII13_08125 [Buchananella hordeovulneris]RRD51666.1 hypothetical protein EII12_07805 [Buchananella hordeovulneris]